MGSIPRELAAVDQARAYQIGELLLVRVTGSKPNACYVVDIERSLLDVEPPAFTVGWWLPPNVRCMPGEVTYELQEVFRVGPRREQVLVHHAGGELAVDVQELVPDEGHALTGTPAPAGGVQVVGARSEAIGYSRNFDFAEAFRDAVARIPVSPIPDWLARYTVQEIGAEIGGIAGFNHLYVRVHGG